MSKPTFEDALRMLREGWRWHSATDMSYAADVLERELGYEGNDGRAD